MEDTNNNHDTLLASLIEAQTNEVKTQNELLTKIFEETKLVKEEIKKANERIESKDREQEEREKARLESGEMTPAEEALLLLKELKQVNLETKDNLLSSLESLVSEIQENKSYSSDTSETTRKLFEMQEQNSKMAENQNAVFMTYALYGIPALLAIIFIYKYLRKFI